MPRVKVRITEYDVDAEGNKVEKVTLTDTTVGRAILSLILPKGLPFETINQAMGKKAISRLLNVCYPYSRFERHGLSPADQIMYTGFHYAMIAGASVGIDDMVIPDAKKILSKKLKLKYAKSKSNSNLVLLQRVSVTTK